MSRGSVAVLGSINMDVVLRVARLPRPGETMIALDARTHPGGKGANQAVAAARAGAATRLIGAMGEDDHGRALLRFLREEAIDVGEVRTIPDRPTGVAHILVDDGGENQIVVASGANASIQLPVRIDAAVLLAQLETPIAVTTAFFGARPQGVLTILNAAPFDAAAMPLFARADIVVVNAVELAGYAGVASGPRDPDEATTLAMNLLASCGGSIVVTLGEQGSVTVGPDGVSRCAGTAARVVDTTGAGDCFCGYLAAGLAAGKGVEASIARAHRAAAIAVSRPGAGSAVPFAHELGDPS